MVISEKLKQEHRGIFNVFAHIPYVDIMPKGGSIFDVFDIARPDIFIGLSSEIDKEMHGQLLKDSPETKIVLFGESTTIAPTLLCRKTTDAFGTVPCLFVKRHIDPFVDLGKKQKHLECDVAYINRGQQLNAEQYKWLFSLLDTPIRFRIYGLSNPFIYNNVGIDNVADCIASTRLILDVDGTSLLVPAANKVPVLSMIENTIWPREKDHTKLYSKVQKMLSEPPDYKLINSNHSRISSNHTSFTYAIKICKEIGDEGYLNQVLKLQKDVLCLE